MNEERPPFVGVPEHLLIPYEERQERLVKLRARWMPCICGHPAYKHERGVGVRAPSPCSYGTCLCIDFVQARPMTVAEEVDQSVTVPTVPEEIRHFDEYQEIAMTMALELANGGDGHNGVLYCALGLAGESGEFANKVAQHWRDGIPLGELSVDELGDALWFMTGVARGLGYSLAEVATLNIKKLTDRHYRGTLQGSGDDR